MQYSIWTTEDGRRIHVEKMTDRYLVEIIQGIEQGSVFEHYEKLVSMLHLGFELGFVGHPHVREYVQHRDTWFIVLKAEAIKRGLGRRV